MTHLRSNSLQRIILVALLLAASNGCKGGPDDDTQTGVQRRPIDFATIGTPSWVAIYDPERASNGYTLVLHNRRIPILIDMNGRVVHSWPELRVMTRARLYEDGSLLTIDLAGTVSLHDWDGELLQHWELPNLTPHHDMQLLDNGHLLVLTRKKKVPTDELLELAPDGTVVWSWSAAEHLEDLLERSAGPSTDITHINSLQILPENRHFSEGDERFRPGNLLMSARNLSTIFIVDRTTGDVVWDYSGELDFQHEARMAAPDEPYAGQILLLDNGYRNQYRYRQSRIVELDPADQTVSWEYVSPTFYTSFSGLQLLLPNGNVLVSSSRGGRAFEVTREGAVVWQWTPPFEPRRPHRIPYDYCPQLAELPRPEEQEVVPSPDYAHLDPELYEFARLGEQRNIELENWPRVVLESSNQCRRLRLPDRPTLEVGYGVERDRLETGETALFTLTLRAHETVRKLVLDEIGHEGESWHDRTIDLSDFSLQDVELCVAAEIEESPSSDISDIAFWSNPQIAPPDPVAATEQEDDLADLSPEELETRREHLKALGYVD